MSDYIVGLTGGIGSGKTTVANLFAELGITLIDADIIARELVAPNSKGHQLIVDKFGQQILLSDGQLNRKKLREHVFNHNDDRIWLNNLLHPMVRNEMLLQAKTAITPYAIMVIPLLFENGLETIVDRVLVVDLSETLQLERTSIRDQTEKDQVKAIVKHQINREQRLAKANDIINNQGQIAALKTQVLALHEKYLTLVAGLDIKPKERNI